MRPACVFGARARNLLYYTFRMMECPHGKARSDRPRLLQDVHHRVGASVFAAVAAGLVALAPWPGAEAAEAQIEGFSFGCEAAGGEIVKPRHGDIEGVSYGDLPAQRALCLGTIDRKIALCWDNTEFEIEAWNQEFAACLLVFHDQARACVGHFSLERSKCGADDPGPIDEVAAEEPALEGPPRDRYRVKPLDRLMSVREAANVRTGPGPDYDIVGTVLAGDELRATGEVRGRDWLQVAFPGSGDKAYIYAPLLHAVQEAPRPAPASEESTETASPLEPAGPSWSIAENEPCQVWNYGNRNYEPFTWSGPCADDKASGQGRLTFRGGEGVYEGTMRAGKMHGSGVFEWSNGFRYEGELREGKQHGFGTYVGANGERYEGEWRNGRPNGQGTYVQSDGSVYEGAWRDGCFGSREGRWASIGTTAAACGFE